MTCEFTICVTAIMGCYLVFSVANGTNPSTYCFCFILY